MKSLTEKEIEDLRELVKEIERDKEKWLREMAAELQTQYDAQYKGETKVKQKVTLLTADGLSLELPQAYDPKVNTFVRPLSVNGKIVGQRTYYRDKFRDGEYRENPELSKPKEEFKWWEDDTPATKSKKKEATPKTIKDLLAKYSLTELIAMKLEDVEFKGQVKKLNKPAKLDDDIPF